jgi:hypothetical protein
MFPIMEKYFPIMRKIVRVKVGLLEAIEKQRYKVLW